MTSKECILKLYLSYIMRFLKSFSVFFEFKLSCVPRRPGFPKNKIRPITIPINIRYRWNSSVKSYRCTTACFIVIHCLDRAVRWSLLGSQLLHPLITIRPNTIWSNRFQLCSFPGPGSDVSMVLVALHAPPCVLIH